MDNAFDIAFKKTQNEQESIQLKSSGEIPMWVNGSYFRNGPGTFSTSSKRFKHWFDGLAMIHRFDIQNGKVEYASKYLDTNVKESIIDRDSMDFPEFATDPCYSIFQKLKSWFVGVNPKVNIQNINGRLISLGETMMQLEIDEKTLESIGVHNYNNHKLTAGVTTAHPHIEEDSMYNVVLKMGVLNYYDILEYNVERKRSKSICKIPIAKPSYIHSMGMSKNYFILAHFPYECTSINFLLKKRPFIENFNWNENKKTQIFIVSKKTGKLIHKLKTEPFFAFHFINAFEKDNRLIFDLGVYPNADIIDSFYLEHLANENKNLPGSKVERFTFNFETEALERRVISEQLVELVTLDDRLRGADYAHVYGAGISDKGLQQFYDQLVKINLKTGEHIIWKDPDYYPSEPKFIPKENGNDDEGIVLSILINVKDKTKGSKLLFLDAKTFKEIASCETPQTIVPGFHTCFLS